MIFSTTFLSNQDVSDDTGRNDFTRLDPSKLYSLVYVPIWSNLVGSSLVKGLRPISSEPFRLDKKKSFKKSLQSDGRHFVPSIGFFITNKSMTPYCLGGL